MQEWEAKPIAQGPAFNIYIMSNWSLLWGLGANRSQRHRCDFAAQDFGACYGELIICLLNSIPAYSSYLQNKLSALHDSIAGKIIGYV